MRTLNPEIARKIDALDFTNEKKRLMDPKLGKGWSQSKVDEVEKKYKNFLKIVSIQTAVPSKLVDIFWHEAILNTKKYSEDCQKCFGRFIHHDPFGLSNDSLKDHWQETNQLYKTLFGENFTHNE